MAVIQRIIPAEDSRTRHDPTARDLESALRRSIGGEVRTLVIADGFSCRDQIRHGGRSIAMTPAGHGPRYRGNAATGAPARSAHHQPGDPA